MLILSMANRRRERKSGGRRKEEAKVKIKRDEVHQERHESRIWKAKRGMGQREKSMVEGRLHGLLFRPLALTGNKEEKVSLGRVIQRIEEGPEMLNGGIILYHSTVPATGHRVRWRREACSIADVVQRESKCMWAVLILG